MKKFISTLAIFTFLFAHIGYSDEEVYYTDEDDELFNHGKFVGQENNIYLKQRRMERNKNWAIAIGTTAIGVATLILVGKNHNSNR